MARISDESGFYIYFQRFKFDMLNFFRLLEISSTKSISKTKQKKLFSQFDTYFLFQVGPLKWMVKKTF